MLRFLLQLRTGSRNLFGKVVYYVSEEFLVLFDSFTYFIRFLQVKKQNVSAFNQAQIIVLDV